MNTLTKAQILALFLGSASATTIDDIVTILNGPSDAANLPAGMQSTDAAADHYQALTTAMSGAACASGNGDCTNANEKCGYIQVDGGLKENRCLHENFCQSSSTNQNGALGRVAGTAWFVECWVDSGSQPADKANIGTLLTDLRDLISEKLDDNNNDESYDWTKAATQNLLVSPRYNYQDGWWIQDSNSKWAETDKPAIQQCGFSNQCASSSCCMQTPDTNNRRCRPRTEANAALVIGPITIASPKCEPESWDDFVASLSVTNAQDDAAAQTLAEATTALQDYLDNLKADARDRAGYKDFARIAKGPWDTNYKTTVEDPRTALYAELKTQVGYDSLNDTGKALFEEELLKWEKAYYTTCKADEKAIACRQAFDIMKDEQKARSLTTYYSTMTAAERTTYEKGREEEVAALESTLAVAWLKDNAPASGAEGSSCETNVCTTSTHCCGTSTPKSGAYVTPTLDDICVDSTTLKFTDGLGREYDHVCSSAAKLLLSVATLAAFHTLA